MPGLGCSSHDTARPVGPDHDTGLDRVVDRHRVAMDADTSDGAPVHLDAAGEGGLDETGVEHRARDDPGGSGHPTTSLATSRTHDAERGDRVVAGSDVADPEFGEQVERLGSDTVTAHLVAWEDRSVEQQHPPPGAGAGACFELRLPIGGRESRAHGEE